MHDGASRSELIFVSAQQHVLISDNILVRKSYFNSNIIARIWQCFFLLIILKRTSTEAHVYMRRHQTVKVKHFFDVSNVIYHKFSHGAVSYTLNGETVNVTLKFLLRHFYSNIYAIMVIRILIFA